MSKCYQYGPEGYFICETDDFGGFLPAGAVYDVPEIKPGFIPKWDGKTWQQVETNKGKEGWLNGVPNTIKDHGPLPSGWSDTPPPPTLAEAQAAKAASIVAAHEAALAGAIAMSAPTPSIVAVEACLLAVSDPEGLEFVHNTMAAQRQTLLAAVDAATSVEAVQAIVVSYAV